MLAAMLHHWDSFPVHAKEAQYWGIRQYLLHWHWCEYLSTFRPQKAYGNDCLSWSSNSVTHYDSQLVDELQLRQCAEILTCSLDFLVFTSSGSLRFAPTLSSLWHGRGRLPEVPSSSWWGGVLSFPQSEVYLAFWCFRTLRDSRGQLNCKLKWQLVLIFLSGCFFSDCVELTSACFYEDPGYTLIPFS